MRVFLAALCALLLLPLALRAQQNVPQTPGVHDLASDAWVGTDALGRTLPTSANARPFRKDRFVGIFYFLTHGAAQFFLPDTKTLPEVTYGDDPRVLRDNTEMIQQAGGDPLTKPAAWKDRGAYWWGQPAVGYFLADDPWVARKNLQMLAEAGVDVLIFDVTNGPQYPNAYHAVLDAAEQMRREGNPTPQFMFISYSSTGVVADQLYDNLYAKGLYKDLWFQWQGKPLILGNPNGSGPLTTPPRSEVRDFFTWRFSWANTDGPERNSHDEWQWIDVRGVQKGGWHDDPLRPEEAPVALGGWANANLGRSFQHDAQGKGLEPPLDPRRLAADRDKGLFFAEQWRNALKIDPQFLFVTGWNEWTAGRQYNPGVSMLGHVTQPGQYYFVDNFNEEFSRDAMPMKGGHSDNYYMQLVDGIRRFKGIRPPPPTRGFHAISLSGGFAQWMTITPRYLDAVGDTERRDWPGWGGQHYTDMSGRNDIVSAKVACDAKNICFYVHTQEALTPYNGPNWMQLLIDADQNTKTGWNGYDFVVNRRVLHSQTTTLTRLADGKTWPVKYHAAGNEMQIVIPRALLGLTNLNKTAFDFHWVDNAPVGGDPKRIADWWYVGDSAPDGRFNYRYLNVR